MNNLPDEMIVNIFKYLPNYDIFNVYKINKNTHRIFEEYNIFEMSFNRKHPVVFNAIDNYCYICNLTLTIITMNNEFQIMSCRHC